MSSSHRCVGSGSVSGVRLGSVWRSVTLLSICWSTPVSRVARTVAGAFMRRTVVHASRRAAQSVRPTGRAVRPVSHTLTRTLAAHVSWGRTTTHSQTRVSVVMRHAQNAGGQALRSVRPVRRGTLRWTGCAVHSAQLGLTRTVVRVAVMRVGLYVRSNSPLIPTA
jgi:hypothetical protein